ncbi:hypothetical protein [Brevibacillus laterosporus]|uniref:hypothetical protein n=1 Tax=Brevibacillus laterosporus TaxID=1465 RepID=UPI000CE31720|nr:hypothetical protein [Brevibacillus laterosporus]MED1664528.1 hypothetical protein [Brevibacillus laterosporus]MED1669984.1 hypothetical protein [Brevibacillus laterosporus]MED1717313.1 hypothetical protein [Brevibacillus laterosporus]PPA82360.1 hypothetical protein C4A76_21820 [Brevibacillus laterosporus]
MKRLEWSNGAEWGEIFCPMTDRMEMTYWKKRAPRYDTFTAPMVDDDGNVIYYQFDHDEGCWHEDMYVLCSYEKGMTISF